MKRHTFSRVRLLVCAVSMLSSAQRLVVGQVTTGGIVGVVTDASGSNVPEAAVTIREVETSTTITVKTDGAGSLTECLQ